MAPLFQITALLFLLSAGFLPLHVPPAPQPKTERFIGSFDLIANQDYPNGTTRSDTVSYFFGMHETAILIHAGKNQPDMRMVINPTDSTITGLFEMQGKKGGYVLPMNDRYWPGMRHALEATSNTVQPGKDPLGDSKMIEGYRCRKVFAESSDYTAELWLTEEIPLSMVQVLSYQAIGAGKSLKELEQFEEFGVNGLPLEMNLTSKKGKANVAIRLVNFQKTVDPSIFSREGHTLSAID